MKLLKQSTAFTFRIGPFIDEDDGKTAETALSLVQADIQISKNGGAFAQTSATSPTTTHDSDGWYQCPLTVADTGTLGPLTVQIHKTGALPVWETFLVVPANVYDSYAGSDKLETDVAQWLGTAPNALQSGRVDSYVGAFAADVITASAIADDAFAAEHFATDAFTDDVFATSALNAIRDNLHAIIFTRMETQIDPSTGLFRIGWRITDLFGDLPTTAEITPGTVSIARKVSGTGTYIAVTTDSALSEQAGQIYLQRAFDPAVDGFAEGDTIRLHWKSISVTINSVTYELCDATGTFTYDQIYNTSADVLANTQVDTATTQTSLILDAGPQEDDVLNGHFAIFTDNVDGSRKGTAIVSDWDGGTLTLTLEAGAQFTIASGDRVQVVVNDDSDTNVVSLDTAAINSIRDAITGGAYALDTDANGRVRVVSGTAAGEIDLSSGAVTVDALTTSGETAIEAEVNDALVALHLDHFFNADYDPASPPGVATAWANEIVQNNGSGVTQFTTTALENGPGGGGGSDWTTAEKNQIRYRLNLDGTQAAPAVADAAQIDVNTLEIEGADPTDTIRDSVVSDATRFPGASITEARLSELDAATSGKAANQIDLIKTEADKIALTDAGAGVAGSVIEEIENRSTHDANAVRDAILSDSTPFPGASLTEARLSELDAATSGKMANQVDLIKTEADKIALTDAGAGVAGSVIEEIENRSTHDANAVRDAILSDSTPFPGASLTEARLSELDAATAGKAANQIDLIEGRLPSALVGGKMDSNVGAINNSTTAAVKLAKSANTIVEGAAIAGTLSTTQMSTDLTETRNDQYNDRVLIWTSGVLKDQATEISDYDGTTKVLTFVAVNGNPSATDEFIIV
jgi:hypothetical protein